jgi:glycosyltransferase involved in cell wall biosynthesis
MKVCNMRIAFIVSEVFTEKRHGGFGWLVRVIGRELVKRGFEVFVLAWRDPGYPERFHVDGLEVITYPYAFDTKSMVRHVHDYYEFSKILRDIDADVFISIEAMVETLIAEILKPSAKHIVWAQDPFDWTDYQLLGSIDPNYRISRIRFWINRIVFGLAYRKADLILSQARCYIEKLKKLYGIDPKRVVYLPNPIDYIPDEKSIRKSEEPLVCYLGRMDPQKRYWIFFELAKQFPDIKFVAMGKPNILYEDMYKEIIKKYIDLPNLEVKGFVSEEEKRRILDKCWIMVLPSIREGLPIAMLEALAHKCALLSSVNPDGLTEKFGYWARNDDFSEGIKWLLKDDKWRRLGEEGYKYVEENHDMGKVIDKLVNLLKTIISGLQAELS